MFDINIIKYLTCMKYNSFQFFGLILPIYQFLLFFQYLFQSTGKKQNPCVGGNKKPLKKQATITGTLLPLPSLITEPL